MTRMRAQEFLVVAIVLVLGAQRALAIFLDDDRKVSVRMRVYSQASVRLSDSQDPTTPITKAGQLVQHRNFYNPELDAVLTSYMGWMDRIGLGVLKPSEFTFRVAGRGFYDGIYDY